MTKSEPNAYNHAQYEPARKRLRWMIDNIAWRWLAKIESVTGVENLPVAGPAIIMINHIAFIDPIVVMGNLPRNIVPMAKREVYDYPVWGIFPKLWNVIPVDRDGLDLTALKSALAVLKAGEVILVAPEGTRHPALQDVQGGFSWLAVKSKVPIVPVAIEGTPGFPSIKKARWQQPGAQVKLGKPFVFTHEGRRTPPRDVLKKMTDEAMYILAEMLPEERRGAYADLENATTDYIQFL